MPFRRTRLVALLAISVLLHEARAQVPEGSAVVCTYTNPTLQSGAPGLFVVPLGPLGGGPTTAVTGLPPELSTNGNGAYGQGGVSVSIRCSDGAVIVTTVAGEQAPNGGQVELFVLHLDTTGSAVARTQRILLGAVGPTLPTTGMPNVGAALNRVLPNGRILVAAFDRVGPLASGPMAGRILAIVDTSSGAFQRLPNPPTPPLGMTVGGLAVDPSGDFAYYLLSASPYQGPSELHRIQLATGMTCPTPIATWTNEAAFGLTCDDDGVLYVSSFEPATPTHFIHTVRPNGCNPAAITSRQSLPPLYAKGLDLDRGSPPGYAAICNRDPPLPLIFGQQVNALCWIDKASGNVSVLANGGVNGWGVIGQQGVAVNNAIESYGAPSPGQNSYWFDNFPNPGGSPTLGNLGFSLTTASAPGRAPFSALALSFGRGSTNVLGIELLLDPSSTVVQLGPPVPYTLPIPNNPALAGLVVTAQSLHLETGGGLAASRGLTLTVQ